MPLFIGQLIVAAHSIVVNYNWSTK